MSRRSTSGAEAAQTHPQRRGPMVVSCPRSASPRRQLRSGACTPYRTGASSTTDTLYLGNVGLNLLFNKPAENKRGWKAHIIVPIYQDGAL